MSGSSAGAPGTNGYLVSDLVGLALRQLGVGAQGTSAAQVDLDDGVMHLNMMLAQWQRRRWMVPTLMDYAGVATGNAQMLVGAGQDIDIPIRPDKIEAAYARYLGGPVGDFSDDFSTGDFQTDASSVGATTVGTTTTAQFSPNDFDNTQFQTGSSPLDGTSLVLDYPLALISSREDYSGISIKNLRTWPRCAFYSPEFPVGTLNVWPIPQAGLWEIHLICKQPLPSGLKAADTINLPPEYWDAIMWVLAARLAPSYGQQPDPTITAMARTSMQTIRNANTQIPMMGMPSSLAGRGRGNGFWAYQTGGAF